MMLSQILRLPSGYIDNVNDAVIGQAGGPTPAGASKFAGQLGMEIELRQDMMKLKNPAVPVAAGLFQYVRLAAAASSPAVGATVNWDATVDRRLYQVTTAAGTAAGTVLTPNVTPGNYTLIQTKVAVPTGVLSALMDEGAEPPPEDAEGSEPPPTPLVATATAARSTAPPTPTKTATK